jgi:hypothetical protein
MISSSWNWFRQLLNSQRKMKFFANTVLLVSALFFLGLTLIWSFIPLVPNAIGKQWISVYSKNVRDDASHTIASAAQGGVQNLIEKLESNTWRSISRSDRAWPAKRKMMAVLVNHFENKFEYGSMQQWADYWVQQDPRDVDAMAFWFESLRYTNNRKEQGIAGLERGLQLFPGNFELLKFNAKVAAERNQSELVGELHKKLRKLTTDNWRLEWRRKSRDVASWHLGKAGDNLSSFKFSKMWSSLGSIVDQVTNAKMHRKLKHNNGEKVFSIAKCKQGRCAVKFSIPESSSTINLFPAAVSGVSVSEFSISLSGMKYKIEPDEIQSRYMYRQGDWFHSVGDEESHVRISLMHLLGSTNNEAQSATLEFRAQVDAIHSRMTGD